MAIGVLHQTRLEALYADPATSAYAIIAIVDNMIVGKGISIPQPQANSLSYLQVNNVIPTFC